MNPSDIVALQKEYVLPTYAPEKLLVRGKGVHVWDGDGRRYLDFTSGISVCNLGHCHPAVTEAIQQQAATLVHVSNLFMNELQPQLAAAIARHSFNGRVFFGNSGAEANEGMIKFARKFGHDRGRYEIICMEGSFHGRTLATLAATARAKYREGFEPNMPGFTFVPFNDVDKLAAAVTDKTVAILIEPVQGEGGVTPATHQFLATARALCDQHNLLLLFDEVQCGMARTGRMFAYQHHGIEPDAMSMAKALGNGYPIGAFTVQRKHEAVLGVGKHASTFGGTPLACAAALAVFTTMDSLDLLTHVQKLGERFRGGLVGLAGKYPVITDVRGLGLMLGVETSVPIAPAVTHAADHGLLVLSAGDNVLRLLPPLVVEEEDVDTAIHLLDQALGALA